MLGPCDKQLSDQGSESDDVIRSTNEGSWEEGQKRTCFDCGTSKTPLWRGGPAGPKSLCNACGIRSRKKRRAFLGINKMSASSSGSSSDENRKTAKKSGSSNKHHQQQHLVGDGLKQRLLALGREVLMQRSTVERQRRTLGEEEQAAVLLMALSCGSVSA